MAPGYRRANLTAYFSILSITFLIYNPEGFFIHMYEKFYGINGGWGGEQWGEEEERCFRGLSYHRDE
ncbi:hypothetical protein Phum_PHUM483800 [Pediculus humanus corporis]|uniref:Uncharacterized protein n=1 Tax=Pediculus humanus subsp. corporis TaxID=121224 RepID=E0VWH4_PEDHC|nr:uncharacterized protein Phum_PHUM483800 [Pediculus humanus corporis]EEB17730.1 hypothetical protein Phum_PHUM483800 [Pediculus humanus corporis]